MVFGGGGGGGGPPGPAAGGGGGGMALLSASTGRHTPEKSDGNCAAAKVAVNATPIIVLTIACAPFYNPADRSIRKLQAPRPVNSGCRVKTAGGRSPVDCTVAGVGAAASALPGPCETTK